MALSLKLIIDFTNQKLTFTAFKKHQIEGRSSRESRTVKRGGKCWNSLVLRINLVRNQQLPRFH